jgi:TPR repeat protein
MRGEWELPRDAVTAAAWYQRAARMAWDNAVMHYNLGLVYERQGWKQLAADAFARAEKIDRKYRRETGPGKVTAPVGNA